MVACSGSKGGGLRWDDESAKGNRLVDEELLAKEELEVSLWDCDRTDCVMYTLHVYG